MTNYSDKEKESDDATGTEEVRFSATLQGDSGENLSDYTTSPAPHPVEGNSYHFKITINNKYSFSAPVFMVGSHTNDCETPSDELVVTYSTNSEPSAVADEGKTLCEVSLPAAGRGEMPDKALPHASDSVLLNEYLQPYVSDSILFDNYSQPYASDFILLNEYLQPYASDSVLFNKTMQPHASDNPKSALNEPFANVDALPLWTSPELVFENEQALRDVVEFMAERKVIRSRLWRKRAANPTLLVRWRRWARQNKMGWLAVLLTLLHQIGLLLADMLTLLDDVIELSADGVFYTTDYTRRPSTVWSNSYTSCTPPPHHETYSRTDEEWHTEACKLKIKTRNATLVVYLHNFYKGLSTTTVAGRAPPVYLPSVA